jgi:ArsR family transcriptional regulator, arsenate/arsenite/antimonite-responsive transcriptional repressor
MGINAVFEALSHPVRRRILALLKTGPMSAGELADHFDLSKPTLSVHFNKLRDADLVSVERRGTSLIYQLNLSILEEALAGLLSLKDDEKASKP